MPNTTVDCRRLYDVRGQPTARPAAVRASTGSTTAVPMNNNQIYLYRR